jgi:PTH2 family peptidyl-tRNA hydrolase
VKQVLVVNQTLTLPPGKLAAQVAHASIGAYLRALPHLQQAWLRSGMTKIVLGAVGVHALEALQAEADVRDVATFLVADAGRTVLRSGTVTCLGLGPAPNEVLNALTGELKLLR